MGAHVDKVTDIGGDRVLVEGTVDGVNDVEGNPLPVQGYGWLSAMDNHYPAEDYEEDGSRHPEVKSRPMSDDEKLAYWSEILTAAVPVPASTPTVLYQAKET